MKPITSPCKQVLAVVVAVANRNKKEKKT